jgi:Zn-dependent protease with chaperone function
VLVVVAIQLVLLPVTNVVSRRYESEADWMSLEATRDPAATASLFRKFAVEALDQPREPSWAHVMLATHPDLTDRVAMARAWAALR